MTPELPKTVYMRWIDPDLDEDNDNQFLMQYMTLYDSAEAGVEHMVGVYELKEVKKITLKVTEEVIEK